MVNHAGRPSKAYLARKGERQPQRMAFINILRPNDDTQVQPSFVHFRINFIIFKYFFSFSLLKATSWGEKNLNLKSHWDFSKNTGLVCGRTQGGIIN